MNTSELLLESFGRIPEAVEATLKGLDTDKLTYRPGGTGNSIAWLLWHLARVEDAQVATVAGLEQVWMAQDFAGSFGLELPVADTGYKHSSEEVDAVNASAEQLLAYYTAVHQQTVAYVGGLTDEDLDRIVDRQWDPPVTLGARLVSTIVDCVQHVGQAAYAKGLPTN
ncbi:chorismate synthase [Arthrobacter sp. ZBG10]|uniref:mycothiol transferase n=1 Tax=Arthrobacter sp. ZBG10 TaxID=1676590 RepID=UPI000682ACDA|nr:DinB family protein [Arthrobacter sp. ZBG10]KNH21869.1 chorismate synthase [Arthrobacter sp. ZBG10]